MYSQPALDQQQLLDLLQKLVDSNLSDTKTAVESNQKSNEITQISSTKEPIKLKKSLAEKDTLIKKDRHEQPSETNDFQTESSSKGKATKPKRLKKEETQRGRQRRMTEKLLDFGP
ncbi:unnamed protein product, partial [Mesorhabditis belari]|uniref:Uncharacterized protein n=1 Tax=Mesorhabditis belari TaxID=2138241 RepID=A0AAF3EI94_9BILA